MAGDGTSAAGRWLKLLLLIVTGLLIAIGVAAILRGRDWAAAEHQRNYRELEIVGRAIEGWPRTIEGMAPANFKLGRIDRKSDKSDDVDALAVARFTHPDVGAFKIRFGLRPCGAARDAGALPCTEQRSVTVDEADNKLRVSGEVPLRDLAAIEAEANGTATTSQSLVDSVFTAMPHPAALPEASLLHYWTELSLERIANLVESAPNFETAFVVDGGGRVVASLGGRPLPVASIEDIIASDSDLGALFLTGARLMAANGSAQLSAKPNDDKLNLRANAEPVSVQIAGDSYIVYVRPLNFPAPWTSNCVSGPDDKAQTRCKLVGLARQKDVYARSLRLAPDLLTLAAIFLTLAVALVPVMKLRFLGPAGHLTPLEVIAAIFGIVAAFALAVLAGMLLVSSLLVHAQSQRQLESTANALAAQFEAEFSHILSLPIDYALIARPTAARPPSPTPDAPARPPRPLNPVCNAAEPRVGGQPASVQFIYVPAFGGAEAMVWPLRETAALANAAGFGYAGTGSYSNRCSSGTRFEIGNRRYFRSAVDGSTVEPFTLDAVTRASFQRKGFMFRNHYAVESVRSQADANDKVLVAVPFDLLVLDAVAPPDVQRRGVLFQSMTLRSFLAPVLPSGIAFMVIDTSDPEWPYIFGSNARRVGIDRLHGAFGTEDADTAIAAAVRAARGADGGDSAQGFEAVFEGKQQQFVVRGLKGTPWVLIAHQPMREVDGPLAATASFAAAAWFGLALIGVLVFAAAWAKWRKASWLWLWPRPSHGARALRAAGAIGVLLLLATLLIFAPMADHGVLKVWLAVLVPIAASVLAWREVGRAPAPRAGAILMPADERGYRWLFVTLFLAFGALPMLALWNDAARVTRARNANAEIAHLEAAWYDNRTATLGILKSIKLDDIPALEFKANIARWPTIVTSVKGWPDAALGVGLPGLDSAARPADAHVVVGFSDWLHSWAGMGQPPRIAACSANPQRDAAARYCVGSDGRIGLVDPDMRLRGATRDISRPGIIAGLLAMGVLLLLLRMSIGAMVRALFGFGTPLEAVTYPTLARSHGKLELPERAVVLNGPLALQLELLGNRDALDLGQTEAQRGAATGGLAAHRDRLAQGETVVVVGLEIALRDPALAETALSALEELSLVLDRKRRADGSVAGRLVVLTDLSPLDRILQAYEREQSGHASDQPLISRQQQLRWSRLFEDFTTIVFRPTPKFLWNPRVEARCRAQLLRDGDDEHGTQNRAEGVLQLVREARFLPEVVLNSLIDPRHVPTAATWAKLYATTYPISMTQYGRLYWRPVWAWAQAVAPATHAAAVDYLRGTLIEHYQHLWVASSRAERVILDNLARGRVVSIEAALALRSLIRRGLVVLDPEPRLINGSFGAFVRQAERPDAMAAWRKEQGKSGWDRAALPIAILLPAAILALAGLALMAGESFTTVFPVILGVGPALLSTFGAGRKQG